MALNKVFLIGNLGRDPELREVGRSVVCDFSLATTERFKNRDKEWEERTEWHKVVVWGKSAEACADNLRKGAQVYVEGKIQSRKWDDKDGNERISFEIIAANVQFLDSRGGGGGGRDRGGNDEDNGGDRSRRAPRRPDYSPRGEGRERGHDDREQREDRPSRRQRGQPTGDKHFDDLEDDIPF